MKADRQGVEGRPAGPASCGFGVRWHAPLALWILLPLWLFAALSAHAEELDAEGYGALLRQVEVALESARRGPAEEQAAAAAGATERLRAVAAVRQGGGSLAPFNRPLLRALESQPPDLDGALAGLEALRQALRDPPQPQAAEEKLAALSALLARPEFQFPEGEFGALDPLLGPIVLYGRRLVFEALVAVGEAFLGQGAAGLYLAGGLAAGVVAASVLFVWRSLRGSLVADIGPAAGRARQARLDSLALWLEGQRLADQGEARSAIRAFFLSAALHLDEAGLLPFDPSLTNREHLARLGRAELRSMLEPLVADYDTLWYSHAACGRPELERIQGLAARVRSVSP